MSININNLVNPADTQRELQEIADRRAASLLSKTKGEVLKIAVSWETIEKVSKGEGGIWKDPFHGSLPQWQVQLRALPHDQMVIEAYSLVEHPEPHPVKGYLDEDDVKPLASQVVAAVPGLLKIRDAGESRGNRFMPKWRYYYADLAKIIAKIGVDDVYALQGDIFPCNEISKPDNVVHVVAHAIDANGNVYRLWREKFSYGRYELDVPPGTSVLVVHYVNTRNRTSKISAYVEDFAVLRDEKIQARIKELTKGGF